MNPFLHTQSKEMIFSKKSDDSILCPFSSEASILRGRKIIFEFRKGLGELGPDPFYGIATKSALSILDLFSRDQKVSSINNLLFAAWTES